jgi:hypothetical protein
VGRSSIRLPAGAIGKVLTKEIELSGPGL